MIEQYEWYLHLPQKRYRRVRSFEAPQPSQMPVLTSLDFTRKNIFCKHPQGIFLMKYFVRSYSMPSSRSLTILRLFSNPSPRTLSTSKLYRHSSVIIATMLPFWLKRILFLSSRFTPRLMERGISLFWIVSSSHIILNWLLSFKRSMASLQESRRWSWQDLNTELSSTSNCFTNL